MLFFDYKEVYDKLSFPICINLMKKVFIDLENGLNTQIQRTGMGVPNGVLAYMPCYLGGNHCFGAKLISVYPGNAAEGYPSHQGYVMVFDEQHGTPVAIADACAITEIRTACASAAATDLLANADSQILAILGSGAQARTHLAAMLCIRPIKEVHIWSYHNEHAEVFADKMSNQYNIPFYVHPTVESAVKNADIVCSVCRTKAPIIKSEYIAPGTHINAVGTCNPFYREIDSRLAAKSRFFVDQIEACKEESGDFLIPLKEGLIDESHIIGTIGGILCNRAPARQTESEITIFDSLGLAVEDLICADYLYRSNQ